MKFHFGKKRKKMGGILDKTDKVIILVYLLTTNNQYHSANDDNYILSTIWFCWLHETH